MRPVHPFREPIFFGHGRHSVLEQRELVRQVRELCTIISGLQQSPNPSLVLTKQDWALWKEGEKSLRRDQSKLKRSIKIALDLWGSKHRRKRR